MTKCDLRPNLGRRFSLPRFCGKNHKEFFSLTIKVKNICGVRVRETCDFQGLILMFYTSCGTQKKCRREDPVTRIEAVRLRAVKPGAPLLIFPSLGPAGCIKTLGDIYA